MKKKLPVLILVLCAAVFVAGLAQLFRLRFEAGDVYPEYSSLRADPLGTMAFYESLEKMPRLSVRRDFSTGNRLPEGQDTTYLHLAASRFDWTSLPQDLAKEIDAFLARGGRLVITFFPETTAPFRLLSSSPKKSPAQKKAKPDNKSGPAKPAKPEPQPSEDDDEEDLVQRVSIKERWGVEFGRVALQPGVGDAYQPAQVENQTGLPLPETLEWHSAMVFTNLDRSWQTIYARGTNPVVVERWFGAGTVVMATDSYFLSNEALSKDRHSDLLAWCIGPGRHVVFDEAHLGITETLGVAGLMRQYRLHGLMAGLLLLAGLFIWKNSLSFAPPYPDEKEREYVAGKDAAAGFVNLLRRNIVPRDVLNVCFAEWTKSLSHRSPHTIARVDQAQTILEAENALAQHERDPVRAYQEICRVLKGPKL